ncbi:acyl-CoA dehydrogenase C-terminal domain-containing protein, partial [Nocardia acidivorans]|uniref:acyl-CoA dehydrogenase C-terminal domain-containing protein n=1 Tax=Nocardia acidivorans TaxID=404580 RepID=UPI001470F9B6
VQKFIEREGGNGRLKAERKLLATALEDVQAMAATLTGHLMAAQQDPKELYKVGLGSVRFLMAVGDLLIGWQLLQHAEVAIKALDNGSTEAFYTGKIATAQFFARNVLPELTATRAILSNLDNDIMELDEAAF